MHAVGFNGGYDEEEKWLVGSNIHELLSILNTYPNRIGNIPLRRIGTPTEAGRVILAVVSPLFSYVTGQVSQPKMCGRSFLIVVLLDNHGKRNLLDPG